MTTLATSFLIGSSLFLQVTRTTIKSRMGSKFGKIRPERPSHRPDHFFFPEMVLAVPHFWANMFFSGHFLTFPSRPLLMTDFVMIND